MKLEKYHFVRFDGTYTRGDIKIAINKSGLIRLSPGFCKAANIASFNYVVLFYDHINKAIALKFINTQEEGALKITRDRTAATISAKTFLKANNLGLKSIFHRYDWEKATIPHIGQVFIIELGKNETTS
jgi:hypothetical protein